MGKYVIEFTEEIWHRVEVEADSAEQASEFFWSGDVAYGDDTVYSHEIQDSVEIMEAK